MWKETLPEMYTDLTEITGDKLLEHFFPKYYQIGFILHFR